MSKILQEKALLKEMLDNGELLNGTILTEDGGVFRIHLEVLYGQSPYFRRIIRANKKTKLGSLDNIPVPGISKEAFAGMVEFMYCAQLTLTSDKVDELLKAAEELEMPDAIGLCKRYLIDRLNDDNCIDVYRKYSRYEDLKEAARNYILAKFQQIFPVSSKFLQLPESDVVSILSSDRLNVKGEEWVFWAAMRWVEADPLARVISGLPDLLRCVRLGLCNPQFYERSICPNPYVSRSEECQSILVQANQLLFEDKGSLEMYDARHPFLRPRVPHEVLFVMGGWSAGSATNVLETFDIKSGRWFLSLATDTVPRAYHGMVWHLGHVYVIGGFDGNQCFNSVRRFDPQTHQWEERGCMHERRCYVSVASTDSHVYAMGGYDGHRRNSSCERYDASTNLWEMVASMNHVRSDASADSLNGKVYIAGGFNGQQVLSSAECYDPELNVWTNITDMSSPRSGVRLVAYVNHLYVLGGFNGSSRLDSVQKYDLRTKSWYSVTSMLGPRSNFAAAILFDCLYVVGGFNGLSTISTAECYCHQRNTWVPVTDLNLNRSALAACTVSGIPNAHEYTFLGNVPYP